MMLVMLPFFMLAMYEKHGQPLEKIVGNIIKVAVIRPKAAPVPDQQLLCRLERQEKLDKEVYDIVHGKEKAGCTGCSEKTKNRAAGQKKMKKLSRADRKQIEAAIARANRTDKKEKIGSGQHPL